MSAKGKPFTLKHLIFKKKDAGTGRRQGAAANPVPAFEASPGKSVTLEPKRVAIKPGQVCLQTLSANALANAVVIRYAATTERFRAISITKC